MAAQLEQTYKKRTGTSGAGGHFMEINLLTLFKLQGDKKLKEFYLAGNLGSAGDFDDVVFRYTDTENRQNVIFLQAKSKDNANHKVIINKFKKGGEWELHKYFQTYLSIRDKFTESRNADPIFQGGIATVDCNFVIYTNAIRDESLSEYTDELRDNPLSVVLEENYGHAFRLKAEAAKDIFREVQDDNEVEQVMTWMKAISGIACKTLKGDENFQMYHAFFTHTVFIKRDKFWKLQDEFLDGVVKNKALEKFREKVFDWYADTKLSAIKCKIKQEREKVKMEISKWILELPDWFEKQAPKFDKELCDKFIDISRENISDNVCAISNLSKKSMKKITELVGNVFVFDENNAKFKLNEQKLDGEPGKVLEYLTSKLILDTPILKFDFQLEKFPRLSLGFIPINYNTIFDFNSKLTILTGQANEIGLEKIIKKTSFSDVSEGEAERRYLLVKEKITSWWKQSSEPTYLKKNDGLLNNIMKGIIFNLKCNMKTFIGRMEELKNLHAALQDNKSHNQMVVISQMASVSGLGGIGKTELARQYANEYQNSYDGNVVWIDADNHESMAACFRRLCKDSLNISTQDANNKEKDITSIVREVYNFFQNRRSLFIFDNANQFKNSDDTNDGIEPFLQKTKTEVANTYFLITSRSQRWPMALLELKVFTDTEAEQLVRSQLEIMDREQEKFVKELIKQLHNFPLALQQAVAYIRETDRMNHKATSTHFTLHDYLKLLNDKTTRLLSYTFPNDFPDNYTKTTFMTWNITLAEIERNELGQEAKKIFNIMAFLSPTDIPTLFFTDIVHQSMEKLTQVVNLLADYSMINLHEGVADIHRLVQWVARLTLQDIEKKDVLKAGLGLVRVHVDKKLMNHGVSLWNYACDDDDLVSEFIDVPANIIEDLRESVRYEEAYAFGEKSLHSLQRVLGTEHIGALTAQYALALVMSEIGKYDSSLIAYQYVFDILKRDRGENYPLTLTTQHNIAQTLSNQGKYDAALATYKEVFKKRMTTFGRDNPSTLTTQHSIAQTLLYQGKYDEALASYREIFEKYVTVIGPENPSTLKIQHSIADLLSKQGKYDEALTSHREVFEKYVTILGPDNQSTLKIQYSIGDVLFKQGKYDEALATNRVVFEKYVTTLGPENPRTLATKHNIAQTLSNQGKYDEALASYREVFEKYVTMLGPENPSTLTTQHNIAQTLSYQGKYDDALACFRAVFEKRVAVLGPDNPSTLTTEHGIAQTLLYQGKYDEALASYREVFEKYVTVLGPENPSTVTAEHDIARILLNQGKYDEALASNMEVLDKFVTILGPDHPFTLTTQYNIAKTLSSQGKYDEALCAYKNVLEKRTQILGPTHPDTVNTQRNMAETLSKLENSYRNRKCTFL